MPSDPWIQLTEACAPGCFLCRRGERVPGSLPPEAVIDLLDQAKALGAARVVLFGGEPLLHEALEPVLIAAAGRGLPVELVTTGYRIESREDLLRHFAPGIARIWVEAHAASAAQSDRLRAFDGAWRLAEVAAEVARDAGIPLGARLVPVDAGLDDVAGWVRWARGLGAGIVAVDDLSAHLPGFRQGEGRPASEADLARVGRARELAREAFGERLPAQPETPPLVVVSARGELLERPADLWFGDRRAAPPLEDGLAAR